MAICWSIKKNSKINWLEQLMRTLQSACYNRVGIILLQFQQGQKAINNCNNSPKLQLLCNNLTNLSHKDQRKIMARESETFWLMQNITSLSPEKCSDSTQLIFLQWHHTCNNKLSLSLNSFVCSAGWWTLITTKAN